MPAAGSTAPCSLAAAVLMQNCENLGAMVLSQLISPGHPVFYGAMGGHSEMKSLSSVYGGPENRLVEMAGAQLAQYYGLLSRGNSGISDSPSVNFQAGAEVMFQVLTSAMQSVNLLPGCGHLGSFMGGSLEKLILDAELINYVDTLKRPFMLGKEDLALEFIKEVGPKGNFINHPLTFKRFKTEFYEPLVFARESYGRWQKRGCPTTIDLAHLKLLSLLENYKQPDINPELIKDLSKFTAP
jgi:trimethylamine--corrinoid protein Co-methyltransferase